MKTALLMVGGCLIAVAAQAAPDAYVLACIRNNTYSMELHMSPAEIAQRADYRTGLAKIAADMVRQPHPALVRPLIDGAAIVMEAVAWDKSISTASPDNFDIHLFAAGAPQVCRAGYTEIGKYNVR